MLPVNEVVRELGLRNCTALQTGPAPEFQGQATCKGWGKNSCPTTSISHITLIYIFPSGLYRCQFLMHLVSWLVTV